MFSIWNRVYLNQLLKKKKKIKITIGFVMVVDFWLKKNL